MYVMTPQDYALLLPLFGTAVPLVLFTMVNIMIKR